MTRSESWTGTMPMARSSSSGTAWSCKPRRSRPSNSRRGPGSNKRTSWSSIPREVSCETVVVASNGSQSSSFDTTWFKTPHLCTRMRKTGSQLALHGKTHVEPYCTIPSEVLRTRRLNCCWECPASPNLTQTCIFLRAHFDDNSISSTCTTSSTTDVEASSARIPASSARHCGSVARARWRRCRRRCSPNSMPIRPAPRAAVARSSAMPMKRRREAEGATGSQAC
mmetsp:Transcript_84453/g.273029  ORF Transcript_84453/g.273029 Transcript_84453/m.273029 type:complete len:225 (+) Transcript_84453:374-1048(+)